MLNLSCKKTYDGKVVLDVGGLIFEKGKRYAVIAITIRIPKESILLKECILPDSLFSESFICN